REPDTSHAPERDRSVLATEGGERGGKFEHVRIPPLSLLLEATEDHRLQAVRNASVEVSREWIGCPASDLKHQIRETIRRKRQCVGQELVERHPEPPNVRARVHGSRALKLLGRHVRRGS